MAIKSVLVPLDEGPGSFHVLETAFVVARRFGAHISCVHALRNAESSEPYVFANLTGTLRDAVVSESARAAQLSADTIRDNFVAACNSAGVAIRQPENDGEVSASFEVVEGRPVDVLVECARLSDVTAIASPQLDENTIRQTPIGETLESILLGSGRPVLIVPQEWQARPCQHAAIGWNDTVQSARALAVTIPWLRTMETVTVLVSKARAAGTLRVIQYLRTHGISADIKTLDRGELTASEAILQRCDDLGADFLVVGGYSRARSKQLLFGGVTRHLMKNTDVITVMVH